MPEYGHRATCLHKTVDEIANRQDLLSLAEISHVALIVDTPDIETGACPQVLPPGDDQVLNFEISKRLDNEPYVALDNWCVPSNAHVVFLEALKDILVPEVARITSDIFYRFSSRLVLLVVGISPL